MRLICCHRFGVKVPRVKITTLLLASLLFAAPALVPAQPAPNGSVLLSVTVRDKHGDPVSAVSAADLTLTQDGRTQTIQSFTRDSKLPFHIGLVVDTSRTMMGSMESERKAADKFIDTMLPDGGSYQAFLIHFDREVELLEDLTSTRDKLHTEIEAMGPTRAREDRDGPEVTGDDRGRTHGGQAGKQLYDAIYLSSSEVIKPGFDARNALIVLSDGADTSSKISLNEAIDAADKANVVIFTIYLRGDQPRDNSSFPTNSRDDHRSGYPGGYPGGGYPRPSGRQEKSSVDGRKILQEIAQRTGGRYFEAKKKDNLDEIYTIVVAELRAQYLLTYAPDKPDDGSYHKVALKARNSDWQVDVRQGYYAPGSDTK